MQFSSLWRVRNWDGRNGDRIHSDTLFSAWVSTYARLFGKVAVEELLKQFQAEVEPLFRLSSTFIYRRVEGKTIYYLPRPFKRPMNYPEDDFEFAKEYKTQLFTLGSLATVVSR